MFHYHNTIITSSGPEETTSTVLAGVTEKFGWAQAITTVIILGFALLFFLCLWPDIYELQMISIFFLRWVPERVHRRVLETNKELKEDKENFETLMAWVQNDIDDMDRGVGPYKDLYPLCLPEVPPNGANDGNGDEDSVDLGDPR